MHQARTGVVEEGYELYLMGGGNFAGRGTAVALENGHECDCGPSTLHLSRDDRQTLD